MKKITFFLLIAIILISCQKTMDLEPKVILIYDGLYHTTLSETPTVILDNNYTINYRIVNKGLCKIKQVNIKFYLCFANGDVKTIEKNVFDLYNTEIIKLETTNISSLIQPIQTEIFIYPQCGCETR